MNAAQDNKSRGFRPIRSDTMPKMGISTMSASTPIVLDHSAPAALIPACRRVKVGM